MKKILVLACILAAISITQTSGQTPVCPIIIDDNLPSEVSKSLKNKADQILSSYGYGSVSSPDRTVMSVVVDVVENNVVHTNPPRVSKKIEVTMKIGDVVENMVFGSAVVSLSGVGLNDTKAYIAALGNLKAENKEIKRLFSTVEASLAEYYEKNSSVILDKAKGKVISGNYDEAIAYLISIPPVNEKCYEACQELAITYYIEKVNHSSYEAYSAALAAWTSNKTQSGAQEALQYLKMVSPASESYPTALQLWDDISEKLKQDEVEEKEHAKQLYNDRVAVRNSVLDAVRAIGVAFGEHQPESVTKLVRRW